MNKVIFFLFVILAYFTESISLNGKNKWEQNNWLGWYYNSKNGWISHPIHLWQFTTDELSKDQWIYDTNLKWIYTGKTIYPYIFSNSLNRWLLFSSIDTVKESYFDFDHNLYRSVSFIEEMIEKGIDRIDKPMTDISAAIENQGKLEVYKMENNLANLATIAGAAPMPKKNIAGIR